MNTTLPHTIENGQGEKIIFKKIVQEPDGAKLIIEGHCTPKAGPAMHIHYLQDEGFTVVKGTVACQIAGQETAYYSEGQSVVFYKNTAHRFWNAGADELIIDAWVKPVNSLIFYLETLYAAQRKSGSNRPDAFDAAYLLVKYKQEYGLIGMPFIVKNIIMPLTYFIGKLSGKYKKFKNAPKPIK